jgi:PKD repeat protein
MPLSGVSPLTVVFTDTSTPGDDPITAWAWDFGDDHTDTVQNPTHIFTQGIYTVSLTVTTAAGSNSNIRTAYVNCLPPPHGIEEFVSSLA